MYKDEPNNNVQQAPHLDGTPQRKTNTTALPCWKQKTTAHHLHRASRTTEPLSRPEQKKDRRLVKEPLLCYKIDQYSSIRAIIRVPAPFIKMIRKTFNLLKLHFQDKIFTSSTISSITFILFLKNFSFLVFQSTQRPNLAHVCELVSNTLKNFQHIFLIQNQCLLNFIFI